jgi:homoserine O-acetyltransferase/O-succinyltransferase
VSVGASSAVSGSFLLEEGLQLEREDAIVPCRIGYEAFGAEDGPVVVVLGGISADRHIAPHEADDSPGWWSVFTGPGLPLDTERYRVVGVDWIGGPGESSGPASRPGPEGIPAVTTGDQAAAVAAVLDHLGVERAHSILGASYGAMVALVFGAWFPERTRHLFVIAGAHASHPMATALRALQRRIVLFGYAKGNPDEAVVIARSLAMTTYRPPDELKQRFPLDVRIEEGHYRFSVEDYLEHQGRKFAARYNPDHFLYLCQSLDLHSVEPEEITVPTTLLAVEEDQLVPLWQKRELAERLAGPVELIEISALTGHDAFLAEEEKVGPIVRRVLGEVGGGVEGRVGGEEGVG